MAGQNSPVPIIHIFETLHDPRQVNKIHYSLPEILLTTLCAVICGADSYVEIEEFGESKLDFLKQFLPFENGIPSHDTFGLVFSAIDTAKFTDIFIEWARSLQMSLRPLVAIDGKTLRRSKKNTIPPIHMISAWASQQHLVLGQLKTHEKFNELTAIPELLSLLTLYGSIITIDSAGCYTKTIKTIINTQSDYVIPVKSNQPNLYKDINLFFESYKSDNNVFNVEEYFTIDKGHGRIESRRYLMTDKISWIQDKEKWTKLQTIGCVQSTRQIGEKTSTESRYYISSLPLNVQEFAYAVRNHWSIENNLHWVMDIVFRDDDCRIRTKNAPGNFVIMKHMAQNMLKLLDSKKSMRVKRKLAGWDDSFLAKTLGVPF